MSVLRRFLRKHGLEFIVFLIIMLCVVLAYNHDVKATIEERDACYALLKEYNINQYAQVSDRFYTDVNNISINLSDWKPS